MIKNEILLFDESKSETNIERNKYMNEIIYSFDIFLQSFKNSKFDKNITNNIIDEVSNIIQNLKSYEYIYIPFLGPQNSGKTTLINGIIGKDILPTKIDRGTTSKIIIRYNNSDETIIRKVYLKKKKDSDKDIYYFEPDNKIGIGIDQIKEILNSLNNDNIDDCFYCISTKIKLFDDLGLDDYQKNMIHLIDFPGYEPNNIFEKEINKLLSICNFFILVFRNSIIKTKECQNFMNLIITQAKKAKKKLPSEIIKSSLFVFNNSEPINITDNDIDKVKNDIQIMIPGLDRNSINVCFINAKFYSQYCYEWNFFFNLKNLFTKELNNFSSNNNSIDIQTKGTNKKYNTFCEYFFNLLRNKIRILGLKGINNEQNIDKNVEKEINEIMNSFSKLNNFGDESNYKNKFIKLISFARENINNLSILKKSNIEGFKNSFSLHIYFVYENIQKNIIRKIDEIISILDNVVKNKLEQKEDSFNKINQLQDGLKNNLEQSKKQGFAIIESFKTNIKNSLKNKEDNIIHLLNSKKYQQIFEQINTEIKNHLQELFKQIKCFLNSSDGESLNLNNINLVIKQISDGKETVPELPKFRENIAKAFGYKNKNIDEQIFNEITIYIEKFNKIYDKKGFKEWFCSFFYDSKYLMNNCEMIIDFCTDKIIYLLKQIIEQYEEYINSIINLINTKAISLQLNKEQKEQLDILSDAYIDAKNNIIKIKMKIKDDLYTNTIISP